MSGTNEAREATRGSAVKLGAELSSRGLQLVTSLLLARGLGAAEFGAFGTLSALAVVAAEAADLGLHGTATRALVAGTLPLRGVVLAKLRLTLRLPGRGRSWPIRSSPCSRPCSCGSSGRGGRRSWAWPCGRAAGAARRRRSCSCSGCSASLLVAAVLGRGGAALACFWALGLSTLPAIVVGAVLVATRLRRPESLARPRLRRASCARRCPWP